MSRTRTPLALTLTVTVFVAACRDDNSVAPAPTPSPEPRVSQSRSLSSAGDFIVVLQDDERDVPGTAKRLSDAAGGQVKDTWQDVLKGFVVTLPAAAAEGMSHRPEVKSIEPDLEVTADADELNPPSWGIDRVDQHPLPLNATYSYYKNGYGVHAYILDTGIRRTHSEFKGLFGSIRVQTGVTYIYDGKGTADCHGHGTHVASTVGGIKVGVAKMVTLVPVRVLDCTGHGTVAGIISGLNWVAAHAVKPAVANMSIGIVGGGISLAWDNATNNLVGSGVVTAVSAGNDAINACNTSPARAVNALTVGATGAGPSRVAGGAPTAPDARATYSNYGSCLDLFAPGTNIYGASHLGDFSFVAKNGTSMASPHVAGAAALYLQKYPSAPWWQVADAIKHFATLGVVTGAGVGSPNRLLYTAFIS
jgi:subtilisin family serine protease